MRRSSLIVLALSFTLSLCHAQEEPDGNEAVDTKDPVSVVRAYLKACEAGDVEGALALTGDEEVKESVRALIQDMVEGTPGGRQWLRIIADEASLTPCSVPVGPAFDKPTITGDAATLAVLLGRPLKASFALSRGPDGTWQIDIEETILTTTGREESFMLDRGRGEAGMGDQAQVSPDNARTRSAQALQSIAGLLLAYANEHDDRLPPAETWRDDIEDFCLDKSSLPSEDQDGDYGYALNAKMAGQTLPDRLARRDLVLLFECGDTSRNAVGDPAEDLLYIEDAEPPAWVALASGGVPGVPRGMSLEEALRVWGDAWTCRGRVRALSRALLAYARDHDGVLPLADSWCDDIVPYLRPEDRGPEAFKCPAVPDLECGYAINAELAGMDVTVLEHHMTHVLLLPAEVGVRNEAVAVPLTVAHGRHPTQYGRDGERYVIIGMLNGWYQQVSEGQAYESLGDLGGPGR